MGDAHLDMRIRVIVVTTRAAARSLHGSDGAVADAVRRGLALLESVERDADRHADEDVRDQLRQARAELESLLSERST